MNIYCDGGQNKQTGKDAWATVTDEHGACLVTQYKENINNILKERDITLTFQEVKLINHQTRTVAVCRFDDVASQQNNAAELVAMVMALLISGLKKSYGSICSDSQLLVEYWSKGQVNKKTLSKMDPLKKELIDICKTFRHHFESKGGRIIKISGNKNPSDLGYHKS